MVEYIITKNRFRNIVLNSRSYSGIETYTDHNLVKAEIRLEWHRINKPKIEKRKTINLDNLYNSKAKIEYQDEVEKRLKESNKNGKNTDPQAKWNNIVNICNESGEKMSWYKSK